MKKLISFALLIIFSISIASAQSSKVKKDPVGEWKYEAPYAPEGYNSGTITVGFAEKKYSAAIALTGSEYKLPAENVRFENDSLLCSVFIEDESIAISLKMEDNEKMTGKAVYSEGEIPLTLVRVIKEKDTK